MKTLFETAKQTDSFKTHNDFIKALLNNDSEDYYQLHLDFIANTESGIFHDRLCRGFAKRSQNAAKFLLIQANSGNLPNTVLADVIHILGLMKNDDLLQYIPNFLSSKDENVRYQCIIVLGWLGNKNEIDVLLSILKSAEIHLLRGHCATAMRQIWFNHPDLSPDIIKYLAEHLKIESEDLVCAMMIITLQDILNYKFGLKENAQGEILGNIKTTKQKLNRYIEKYKGKPK